MTWKLPDLKLTHQHMLTAVAVGIAVCAALALYAFRGAIFVPREDVAMIAASASEDVGPPLFRHALTGVPSATELAKPFVFAVMVENMIDSWPQSGLEDAFLVIEAPVEAGISRFVAFFAADQDVEKIGPVRSARPYFVDWADEWRALYAHVGGSDAALRRIDAGDTFDLNEYSFGQFFWRSRERLAPHNVYTSSELLAAALERRQEQNTAPDIQYGVWTFKEDEPSTTDVPNAVVDFSTPTYQVTWDYDPTTNRYARLQAGEPQLMQNGEALFANNVAIVITSVEVIDEVGRREIETLGEGEAFVLQDGKIIEGTWQKKSIDDRSRFFNVTGEEIAWNAGQTWIQVVPDETYIAFTASPE